MPWHYLTYHKPCYFDVQPLLDMGWKPQYSNMDMLIESYDWFVKAASDSTLRDASPHRSPLRQGLLWLLKQIS